MNEIPVTEVQNCTCGRNYSHCRACGSRNVYSKRFRSMELSVSLGRDVTVFGCRRCSEETSETEPCRAPSNRAFKSSFVPYQKPPELPPWGNAVPGSAEHFNALREYVIELTEKKHITTVQAFVEAKKQGWQVELYEMDEEVKEAFRNAGLLTDGQNKEQPQEAPMRGAQEVQSPPIQAPQSLDEIIKTMQENAK